MPKTIPMKKKILIGILIFFLLALGFVFLRTRPSGDINKYSALFADDPEMPANGSVKVSFYGVSTLLVDDGTTQILIDGFFSRPGMLKALFTDLSSDTVQIARCLGEFKMDRVEAVFVTHSHYDHAFDAGYVANLTGAMLYGSESTLNVGRGSGTPENQLQLFQPNVDLTIGDFIVRVVPSRHSPGNALNDDGVIISTPMRQPASMKAYAEGGAYDFLITHSSKKIYIKPSPNFIPGALDSLDVDALFIGIATVTKNGEEFANQFYQENITSLQPSVIVPIHWDNFFGPISDDLVMLPKFTCDTEKDFDYFIDRTKSDGIDFKILQGTKGIMLFNE